jgi:hypothetical protein
MIMTKVEFSSGICGFNSTLSFDRKNDECVTMSIVSSCPHITGLNSGNPIEVDPMAEIFGMGESKLQECQQGLQHRGCPFLTASLKGVEVEAGLALPKDVIINIKKEL